MCVNRGTSGSRDERGLSTAEYAVGCVAATGFAGVLCLCGPYMDELLRALLSYSEHLLEGIVKLWWWT